MRRKAVMFRILTEDVNRGEIERIVAERFPGFTVTPANGYWQGKQESSLAIDIAHASKADVVAVAQKIRRANSQDAVMVQEWPVVSELVTVETQLRLSWLTSSAAKLRNRITLLLHPAGPADVKQRVCPAGRNWISQP